MAIDFPNIESLDAKFATFYKKIIPNGGKHKTVKKTIHYDDCLSR